MTDTHNDDFDDDDSADRIIGHRIVLALNTHDEDSTVRILHEVGDGLCADHAADTWENIALALASEFALHLGETLGLANAVEHTQRQIAALLAERDDRP